MKEVKRKLFAHLKVYKELPYVNFFRETPLHQPELCDNIKDCLYIACSRRYFCPFLLDVTVMSYIKVNSVYLRSKCTGLAPINSGDIRRQQQGYLVIHKFNNPFLILLCHRRK